MSFLGISLGSKQQKPADIKTPLDMVTHAASLASNPTDIDPLLDKVRGITADLPAGQAPSPSDREALMDVYLQLEKYLTTNEPLRTFTREDLRARFGPELLQMLNGRETQKQIEAQQKIEARND